MGENHTIRTAMGADGSVHLMMASEHYAEFPNVLRRLKVEHVARLTRDNKVTEAADLGAALDLMIVEAEEVGSRTGLIHQKRREYQDILSRLGDDARTQYMDTHGTTTQIMENAWKPFYDKYVAELHRLDALYDFSAGRRNLVTVGQEVADRRRDLLVRVTEVNVRDGSAYGVRAVPAHSAATSGGEFLNYTVYSPTGTTGWGPVSGRPPLRTFPPIAPGGSAWRNTRRVWRVTHSNRDTGTDSNRADPVPGITPLGGTRPYRGHLIAKSLGGPGRWASGNIVAMTTNANNSEMVTKLENPTRNALDADPNRSHPVNNLMIEIEVQPTSWTSPDYPDEVEVSHKKIHPVPAPAPTIGVVNNR
jgi:hypothetical protein